jgi:hypothetical protein
MIRNKRARNAILKQQTLDIYCKTDQKVLATYLSMNRKRPLEEIPSSKKVKPDSPVYEYKDFDDHPASLYNRIIVMSLKIQHSYLRTINMKIMTSARRPLSSATKPLDLSDAPLSVAKLRHFFETTFNSDSSKTTNEKPLISISPLITASDSPLSSAGDSPLSSASDSPLSSVGDSQLTAASDSPLTAASDSPLTAASDSPLTAASDSPLSSARDSPLSSATQFDVFGKATYSTKTQSLHKLQDYMVTSNLVYHPVSIYLPYHQTFAEMIVKILVFLDMSKCGIGGSLKSILSYDEKNMIHEPSRIAKRYVVSSVWNSEIHDLFNNSMIYRSYEGLFGSDGCGCRICRLDPVRHPATFTHEYTYQPYDNDLIDRLEFTYADIEKYSTSSSRQVTKYVGHICNKRIAMYSSLYHFRMSLIHSCYLTLKNAKSIQDLFNNALYELIDNEYRYYQKTIRPLMANALTKYRKF